MEGTVVNEEEEKEKKLQERWDRGREKDPRSAAKRRHTGRGDEARMKVRQEEASPRLEGRRGPCLERWSCRGRLKCRGEMPARETGEGDGQLRKQGNDRDGMDREGKNKPERACERRKVRARLDMYGWAAPGLGSCQDVWAGWDRRGGGRAGWRAARLVL